MTRLTCAVMDIDPVQHLAARFAEEIPLTRAMGVRVDAWDGASLHLTAPLEPNVNDKGTAFGGSINNVLTLAGWGLVYLALWRERIVADVVIHTAEMRFLRPVTGAIHGRARFSNYADVKPFIGRVAAGRRGRIAVDCSVGQEAVSAVKMSASFVAWLKA